MPKKTGIAIVAVGAVLILSALLLLLYNRYEDAHAGQEAENLLENVETVIETKRIKVPKNWLCIHLLHHLCRLQFVVRKNVQWNHQH